jgi:hypothetical protein
MTVNLIEEIRKRAFRYYYEDGLVELAVGFQFFVIGAVLWVARDWLEGGAYAFVISVGLFLLIWQGSRWVKFFVMRLKDRITYPRSGAVNYTKQASKGRWVVVAAMAILVLVVFVLPAGSIQMPVMIGVILAIILFFLGFQVGLTRLKISSGISILAAWASTFINIDEVQGTGFVFMATGLLLIGLGGTSLIRYMKNNPAESH